MQHLLILIIIWKRTEFYHVAWTLYSFDMLLLFLNWLFRHSYWTVSACSLTIQFVPYWYASVLCNFMFWSRSVVMALAFNKWYDCISDIYRYIHICWCITFKGVLMLGCIILIFKWAESFLQSDDNFVKVRICKYVSFLLKTFDYLFYTFLPICLAIMGMEWRRNITKECLERKYREVMKYNMEEKYFMLSN